MAMTPLPMGVGGTLFGGGGGGGLSSGGQALMNGGTPRPPMNGFGLTKGPMGGKNSAQQDLMSPHSGMRSTITKGDPLARMPGVSQYGKGAGALGLAGGEPPALHQIRGGVGQMRRIRGGLGPGKVGQAGPSSDYSMNSPDVE
jgi:hypothetical protein